ncbi:hypothetical protein [uncultured Moraxella sp.]|uniref:hypothetical protein n=1 Tax=uncultured Moraxella sp. TaxID=263769 RepID=UPI0025F8586C|nr:hypothetical protein [uncultured Moraxella sp.]
MEILEWGVFIVAIAGFFYLRSLFRNIMRKSSYRKILDNVIRLSQEEPDRLFRSIFFIRSNVHFSLNDLRRGFLNIITDMAIAEGLRTRSTANLVWFDIQSSPDFLLVFEELVKSSYEIANQIAVEDIQARVKFAKTLSESNS